MLNSNNTLVVQEIFKNLQDRYIKSGDIAQIKVEDIIKIYKTIVNLDQLPKPEGFPQNIISSSTDKFVGRERELECLNQQLQRHNEVVISAVEGMEGVGKTELAIQYSLLHLQLNTYPGGIFWLRSREQDIGLQIVNFARTDLGLQPPEDLELPERVSWCWKLWPEGNTLIVIDDVENYSDIKSYLPPQPSQFKVLITTRLELDWASSLYLEVLSEPDALELLTQLVGSEKVNQELATAKDLCQRLGYLPLAVQLVGRYVKKQKISLTEELQALEKKGLGHPSSGFLENNPHWTLDIKCGVEAAFELSWDELKKFNFAQEFGCLLSLFALAPIPWSLIENAAVKQDLEKLEDARVELESLHLLRSEDNYQLHKLIQELLRNKQSNLANADQQKYNFCTAIAKIAKKIAQVPTSLEIASLITIIPHIAETATIYQNWLKDEDLIWPFIGLGKFYEYRGAYEQALPWYKKCLLVARKRLGQDHPAIATSLKTLASLYDEQGRYSEAEPLYLQALEMDKRLYEEQDHPTVATSLKSLASLYDEQGRYSEAEPLYLQALEMDKRLYAEQDHPAVATSLNNLALLYTNQERYSEAEPLYLQALEMYKWLYEEQDHPTVASSLNNLASLYDDQERYSEAEPLYLQALEMDKRLYKGQDHSAVASSLNNLASLYDEQGRYSEAEPLYRQALEMDKRLYKGQDHPAVASSLNNLASLYTNQGRYFEAETLYRQALEIYKRLYVGQDHPNVASSLNNLASLYTNQVRYSEAEPLYLQALEMDKRLHEGEDHPNVASSLNNLASLYTNQGRYSKAESLYRKALEMHKRTLGFEHPSTITVENNLKRLKRHFTPYSPWMRKFSLFLDIFLDIFLTIVILPFYLLWLLVKQLWNFVFR